MAKQTETGKAFEYALLNSFHLLLKEVTSVIVNENSSYFVAKKCYEGFNKSEQEVYDVASRLSLNFLLDLEPKLSNGINVNDSLVLEIASDKLGQGGDVRDVLAIRSSQMWEIGISAKNNHRAVKHSRLSMDIDFGSKWLGIPCSENYFTEIKPVFSMLSELKKKDKTSKWDIIENMHQIVYVPILNAFRKELIRLDKENPNIISRKLVEYLVGNQDFYKIIKGRNGVELQAYNLHGTLNSPFNDSKPKTKIPKLKLPNRLIEVVYGDNSLTTLLVTLTEGWQISFRIHNASSRIEPSLKFDINLVSAPYSLFTTHINL
ncbi:MAG: HaeIII family restriction endonuclease [Bacteroidia bacterium]